MVLDKNGGTWYNNLYIGEVISYHFFKIAFHFISQNIEVAFGVIGLAVVPDELYMI